MHFISTIVAAAATVLAAFVQRKGSNAGDAAPAPILPLFLACLLGASLMFSVIVVLNGSQQAQATPYKHRYPEVNELISRKLAGKEINFHEIDLLYQTLDGYAKSDLEHEINFLLKQNGFPYLGYKFTSNGKLVMRPPTSPPSPIYIDASELVNSVRNGDPPDLDKLNSSIKYHRENYESFDRNAFVNDTNDRLALLGRELVVRGDRVELNYR